MKKNILFLSVFMLATVLGGQLKAEAGNLTDEAAYMKYHNMIMKKDGSQNPTGVSKSPVQAKQTHVKQEQESSCIIL